MAPTAAAAAAAAAASAARKQKMVTTTTTSTTTSTSTSAAAAVLQPQDAAAAADAAVGTMTAGAQLAKVEPEGAVPAALARAAEAERRAAAAEEQCEALKRALAGRGGAPLLTLFYSKLTTSLFKPTNDSLFRALFTLFYSI
jgi:hypothetical protein